MHRRNGTVIVEFFSVHPPPQRCHSVGTLRLCIAKIGNGLGDTKGFIHMLRFQGYLRLPKITFTKFFINLAAQLI